MGAMKTTHLEAMFLALTLYFLLGVAYFGWGKVLIHVAVPIKHRIRKIPVTFIMWIGWALTLFIFQLIHLILPINIFTVYPVFSVGIVVSSVCFVRGYQCHSVTRPSISLPLTFAKLAGVILFILIAAWVASRSMLPVLNFDSGLYHFNAIRWINTYPIIPGLGNLHGRLAFNQSFFTYVAALNLFPLFGHGRSIANSSLALLAFLTMFELVQPVTMLSIRAVKRQPLQWMSAAFCFPILAYWLLSLRDISAPSSDVASSLLQLVLFVVFCRAAAILLKSGAIPLVDAMVLVVLSVTAISIKLSNIAFSGTIIVICLIGALIKSERRKGDILRLLLPIVLVMMLFCLRGVIYSGAPLYPSTIGYIHADWSVPFEQVIDEKNWVYSWARQPDTHWNIVLGNL